MVRRFGVVEFTRYRKAGIDADVHRQGLSDSFLYLRAETLYHLVNFASGSDRPHRIVFMGQGNPEHCHHLIPGKLFDVAPVFADHFGNLTDDMVY